MFFTIAAFLGCVLLFPVRSRLFKLLSLSPDCSFLFFTFVSLFLSISVFVFHLSISLFFFFGRDGVTHVDDDE